MDSRPLREAAQGHMSLIRLADLFPDVPISLVGGVVRDALLGRPPGPDIDLVVEGDAIEVARRLARELGVQPIVHDRFGTAALALDDGTLVDLVTARRESYSAPGALPDVSVGTIDDDLARRDFTVNAMAYRLTGPDAGSLLDPHGGRRDLAAGILRALRADEFAEDPSRILRAARYAARLDFDVDPATTRQARDSAPTASPASARVADELRRLLEEPDAARAIEEAGRLGIEWTVRDPGLAARFAGIDAALAAPGAPTTPAWAIRLGLAVDPSQLMTVAVDGTAATAARNAARADDLAALVSAARTCSEVDRILDRAHPAAQVVVAAQGPGPVTDWWATVRDMRLEVDGDDLRRTGIPPGPRIGELLAGLRAAVVDGEVAGHRDAQLAWLAEQTA